MSNKEDCCLRSYAVRSEAIGGTLRHEALKAGTFFTDDLQAAIRFAQQIPPDEWVTKTIRINALDYRPNERLVTTEINLVSFPIYPKVASRGRQVLVAPTRPADARIPEGPIVGFRTWRLKVVSHLTGDIDVVKGQQVPQLAVDGIELLAMYKPAIWTQPQVRFVCDHLHETPQASCGCGLHAYHHPNEALGEKMTGQGPAAQYPAVIGVISGHGDIQVHGRGWRAEEAHVLAFEDHGDGPEALRLLAELWDVPLIPFGQLEEFAASKGRFISKDELDV